MIFLDKYNFNSSSGLIEELTRISALCINQILKNHQSLSGNIEFTNRLHRLIVHTDPHLDEYFAELIYRSCLPAYKRDIDFIEQSTFSEENDNELIALGPNSAAFGFGGSASGGAQFLALYDEHQKGEGRTDRSCSEIVTRAHCKNLPFSIRVILEEISRIDSSGGAHPQHLNNIIKILHNVRFVFKSASDKKDELKNFLTPVWKRAIIDASISAIVYCIEHRINLIDATDEMILSVRDSFNHYCKYSPHRSDSYFNNAVTEFKKNLFNLKKTFDDSNFKNDKKPQSLIISRIAYACDLTWGKEISKFIMLHYWETNIQGQMIFSKVLDAIKQMQLQNTNRITTNLGTIEKFQIVTPNFQAVTMEANEFSKINRKSLNIYEVSPVPSAFSIHKAFTYYLNGKEFQGFGFILINDKFNGTKALFKGNGIPEDVWKKVIAMIRTAEPGLWYSVSSESSKPAAFILNGNKTHQYVSPSEIDITMLTEILKNI